MVPIVFCLGTEFPMVPYLEMGGSIVFFHLDTEGSKISLFRNGWFQWFSVQELKVPMVNYLEMGGSNGFLFRN